MKHSQAWREFLDHMREVTQLLRVDPQSEHSARRLGSRAVNVQLSIALTKACVLMTSGRLQGCIESIVAEFLEELGRSAIKVDAIPEVLRGNLCLRFPMARDDHRPAALKTAEMHKAYHVLWEPGTDLRPGTLRTDSLPDAVWNPWPKKTQELLARCDVDLFGSVESVHGKSYLGDMQKHVSDLVEFRNQVAHGDEPAALSASDVRLRMKWAIRLARACDEALGARLASLTGGPGWT